MRDKFVLFGSVLVLLFSVTGCGQKKDVSEALKDSRGLYFIDSTFSIYSDEEDPMFIVYGEKKSIKKYFPQLNCLPDCIHGNQEEPMETLSDGTLIYEYVVEDETYYFIHCQGNLDYFDGDILIGKDENKLLPFC